jgi:glycerol-3-phosphate dehydrogenase
VLDPAGTRSRFPGVDSRGLQGGGLWYDAVMTSSVRILMETLRWACHNGARALNYVECIGLKSESNRVGGVEAVERSSEAVVDFRAPVVVNCAGPWSRALALRFDRDHEALFRPSLAFSLLLDREAPSEATLAVTPRHSRARTYFLRPTRNRIVAGTFHASCAAYPASSDPGEEQIDRFLAELNRAVPGLEVTTDDIVRVYAGLLPATKQGTQDTADRPIILDHARAGGPSGLWSVSGVKYTTARVVAEHTLRRVFAGSGRDLSVRPGSERPAPASDLFASDLPPDFDGDAEEVGRVLRTLAEEEAVTCVDDLLSRRTEWTADPRRAAAVAASVTRLLGSKLSPL